MHSKQGPSPRPNPSRRETRVHLLALCILAAASAALFIQVLDTGFWSPEDASDLRSLVEMQASGELQLDFRPAIAGGYDTNPVLAFEFRSFGMDARAYYIVNLIVHVLNAWIAYALVISLLHDAPAAILAAVLFAVGVGSYGKNLMFAGGISSLLYAMVVLSGTLLYVWNEQKNRGRPLGLFAFGFFGIFALSLFMRGGTFSILASCLFYNFFFRPERQRPVMHTTLLLALGTAAVSMLARVLLGPPPIAGPVDPGAFLVNLPRYLVLMAFPVQHSELLTSASPFTRTVYALAPYIRVAVGLALLSYTIFGIVFGNRAIRFYIGWIYVMVVPFAVFRYPTDWLNLRFLYLVSLGFCVLLTSGAIYVSKLLSHRGARRFVPFLAPMFYVVLSVALVTKLDDKNERLAARLDLPRQASANPAAP